MRPGPDQVIACPHCRTLAKYMTLLSGNTFGAQVWTDGKQIAPMLPQPPPVVKCHGCGECYWLADAPEVGTVEGTGRSWLRRRRRQAAVDPAWEVAPYVEEPSEEEYYSALEGGMAKDRKQERNLRVLAMWRHNDAFRDGADGSGVGSAGTPERFGENLRALLELLDDREPNDRFMKVEVLRELGEFSAAKEVLSGMFGRNYVARQLRELCDREDRTVRELDFGT